jgi:hypothetical protein
LKILSVRPCRSSPHVLPPDKQTRDNK